MRVWFMICKYLVRKWAQVTVASIHSLEIECPAFPKADPWVHCPQMSWTSGTGTSTPYKVRVLCSQPRSAFESPEGKCTHNYASDLQNKCTAQVALTRH